MKDYLVSAVHTIQNPKEEIALSGEIAQHSNRLLSLDTFRGMTIAGMILVNNPGSWSHVYPPLLHAEWHGITPTDIIFPFFLFIMGVSIAFAYSRQMKKHIPKEEMVKKIIKRSFILFLMGLFLVSYPHFDWNTFRIPGVLQRIAIVFFVSALLFVNTSWRSIIYISIILLVGYWLVMAFIPVPGVGYANFEMDTNLAAWIDRLFLSGHMRAQTKTWDALGLFSTFPAIVSGLSGVLVGILMIRDSINLERKLIWIFIIGCLCTLAGWIWDGFFPINKNIWTSSYVLYTSGLACLTLGVLYWFIDVLNYKRWTTFFVVYGVNAITAYFLSEFIIKNLSWIKINYNGGQVSLLNYIYGQLFETYFTPVNASLAMAIFWVMIFFIPLYYMYTKKIFVKV
jgi:predicted acyltransferase